MIKELCNVGKILHHAFKIQYVCNDWYIIQTTIVLKPIISLLFYIFIVAYIRLLLNPFTYLVKNILIQNAIRCMSYTIKEVEIFCEHVNRDIIRWH